MKKHFDEDEKLCAFCGKPRRGKNKSKEHILPQWMKNFPYPTADEYHEQTVHRISDTEQGEVELKRYKKTPGDRNTRHVYAICRSCNNGWMSSLEEQSKPIIMSLASGNPHKVNISDLLVLSTWIVKTAMTNEFTGLDEYPSTQSERDWLMTNLAPPPTWRVIISHYAGKIWNKRYFYYSCEIPYSIKDSSEIFEPISAFSTTFAVGQMAAHAVCIRDKMTSDLIDPPPHYRGHERIWPTPQEIEWPLKPSLTEHGMWNLSYAIYHTLSLKGVSMPRLPNEWKIL